jgi:membrane-bound lytic murein transglycosylase B
MNKRESRNRSWSVCPRIEGLMARNLRIYEPIPYSRRIHQLAPATFWMYERSFMYRQSLLTVFCFTALLTLTGACAPVKKPETAAVPPPANAVEPKPETRPEAKAPDKPAADPGFDLWLKELASEARGMGISEVTLVEALTGLQPIPRVVKRASTQAEEVFSAGRYVERMVSENRVVKGRRKLQELAELFEQVSAAYGVQPRYLAALWAIESDFGQGNADFPLVAALATQAWQGRRQAFFRRELLDALWLLDREQLSSADLRGSWAGATGQFQFIPSTCRHYAVDFNGDGHRNIWTDPADALASAANLLARSRWRPGQNWGRRVQLPQGFDVSLAGLKTRKSLAEWRGLGIIEADGPDQQSASLLLPDGPAGPAFLVFDNFRVLMRWNRSSAFALAIGHLADRLGGAPAKQKPPANRPG